MKRKNLFPYLFSFILLLILLSLPPTQVNKVRKAYIAVLSKNYPSFLFAGFIPKSDIDKPNEEVNLLAENQNLKEKIRDLELIFQEESYIQKLVDTLKQIDSHLPSAFFERRKKELAKLTSLHASSVTCHVIYRDPALWSSFVLLDVGSPLIKKNSPVVSKRGFLVGVVEEVYGNSCKVRLITDKRLFVSVRALRGNKQQEIHKENIAMLLAFLETNPDLALTPQETQVFLSLLRKTYDLVEEKDRAEFLAKGEIMGSSSSLWRGPSALLYGKGFNYDFDDEEGEKRHLRSTHPPLILEGDLLSTTGLDGVFPVGIPVAIVTKVEPLVEGGCNYTIEAVACESHIPSLDTLIVLPAL